MNKKLTRVFLAGILALSVATAVLVPAMASVYAADPSTTQDQPPAPQSPNPDPPKDSGNPHSGHH